LQGMVRNILISAFAVLFGILTIATMLKSSASTTSQAVTQAVTELDSKAECKECRAPCVDKMTTCMASSSSPDPCLLALAKCMEGCVDTKMCPLQKPKTAVEANQCLNDDQCSAKGLVCNSRCEAEYLQSNCTGHCSSNMTCLKNCDEESNDKKRICGNSCSSDKLGCESDCGHCALMSSMLMTNMTDCMGKCDEGACRQVCFMQWVEKEKTVIPSSCAEPTHIEVLEAKRGCGNPCVQAKATCVITVAPCPFASTNDTLFNQYLDQDRECSSAFALCLGKCGHVS